MIYQFNLLLWLLCPVCPLKRNMGIFGKLPLASNRCRLSTGRLLSLPGRSCFDPVTADKNFPPTVFAEGRSFGSQHHNHKTLFLANLPFYG